MTDHATGKAGNVAELLSSAARTRPGAAGLVDTTTGTTLTWADVEAAVDAQVAELRAAGLAPGDRVVLRLSTGAAFAIAFYAVVRAGGIAVPLSPQGPDTELATFVEHSGARLIVGTGGDQQVTEVPVRTDPPAARPEPVQPVGAGEDIAVLSYTSGTTGRPRGVMLSHRALLANVDQLTRLDTHVVEPTDRVYLSVPLFHVYGLGPGLLAATSVGAALVLAERFDARAALTHCAEHRVTTVLGVPTMYAEFAALPPDELGEALSTVRLLTSGAAPLHPKVLAAIRAAIGLGVFEGYGLTETAPVLTTTLVTGYPKPGSVGRPLPGVELRLVDSDGTPGPVPLDPADPDDAFAEDAAGTGLVSVRGPNLFSGYWPDGAHGPDAEGWFRTGDVGYLDVDGDLHLVDRANDLIIVNGFNVYPREVEDVINAIPGVAESAVVGVRDERSGEAVKAVIVPEPGAALSEQQVVDACAGRLAAYKVPRTVAFADELPHSPTGKLRRVRLRG
ncbi:long-chain acyl-CoA synthetase [Amycolatopsis arida]|uniref:Long-chain acyl-CoA synthetase n=1 Tax=Amycolatopsis arida TaxID=587909 RepID=A0A1I5Y9B1_9PSEU|nr:AMP-binding protein [Amycolatopsis arida]TDX90369.1 long-chain acyl-CoA synthetase [Amycolatopsis arida]SFQ40778.1 long-chain acyl-CoA synthetase [Amycolatopsis arida]